MTSENWRAAWELYRSARELPMVERNLFLNSVNEDPEVMQEVILLLDEPEELVSQAEPEERAPIASGMSRYAIVEYLGRGGAGEVYSAHDRQLGRIVALKFLRPGTIGALSAERLMSEAKTLSALNHPNIVTVYEVIESSSGLAIVMELVQGVSLRSVCGEPLSKDRIADLGQQIAQALATAHAHGIVHRDIKPENILVRPDGYVKVLDFGLARQVAADDRASGHSLTMGTLRYMSPEQARGEPLTPASDIFSLGLVLYELATGRHAFPSSSSLATVQAILTKDPPPPSSVNPSIPACLNSLILATLAREATARPGAEEVARALKELQTPLQSGRSWKWAIAIAVLLATCFAVWRWQQAQEERNRPSFRQITTLVPENRATAAAISPDGKLAAYANVDGIFIRDLKTGATRSVPAPPDFVTDRLAWFPESQKLAASGFFSVTGIPSIWMISAAGEPARLLKDSARGATPSPNGKNVAYIGAKWSDLWTLSMDGRPPVHLLDLTGRERIWMVFWSSDGHSVVFSSQENPPTADHLNYEAIDVASGKIVATERNFPIISATGLADGRVLFLTWAESGYAVSNEMWEVRTDRTTGRFLDKPRRIASSRGDEMPYMSALSASADGKLVMILKQSEQNSVFTGNFEPHPPQITNIKRLTLDERTSYPHAWTPDSGSVIFESDRDGNYDLYRQDIGSRTPQTLIASAWDEVLPQVSPDGRDLLYVATPELAKRKFSLRRAPLVGGAQQEVPTAGSPEEFRCSLGKAGICVQRTTMGRDFLVYYRLDPERGTGEELARTKWTTSLLGDWDISPDGTKIALPIHDPSAARIRLIALNPAPNKPREREIELKGLNDLRGLNWAADGRGWFLSVDTTVGHRMYYVEESGKFQPLGDIQGWAVPSPDGHRVAFLNRIIATNAWILQRP